MILFAVIATGVIVVVVLALNFVVATSYHLSPRTRAARRVLAANRRP